MYHQFRGEFLEEYGDDAHKIDDYKWTVYTTWTMSFRQLDAKAARFLQLCSFFHHEGISESIFQNAASHMADMDWDSRLDPEGSELVVTARTLGILEAPWDSRRFMRMVREIQSYSLVNVDRVNETYSIHPLVHKWIRNSIFNEVTPSIALFILGLSVSCGQMSNDYAFCRSVLLHVHAVSCDGTSVGVEASCRMAYVYSEGGYWKKAENMEAVVMEKRKRVLGEEHPSTLTSMANLASTYWNQGRWNEAEKLEVAVMEISKRLLGEEHPDTLTSMANLASTYWNQGRWNEAEKLDIAVMEIRKRLLGEDNP